MWDDNTVSFDFSPLLSEPSVSSVVNSSGLSCLTFDSLRVLSGLFGFPTRPAVTIGGATPRDATPQVR